MLLKSINKNIKDLKILNKQLLKTYKEDIEKIKYYFLNFNKRVENEFNKIQSSLVLFKNSGNDFFFLNFKNNANIMKQLILRILPIEIINNSQVANLKQKMQEYLNLDPIEKINNLANNDQKLFKITSQYNSAICYLENISIEMLQLYKNQNKYIDGLSKKSGITANDVEKYNSLFLTKQDTLSKKKMQIKVNRLLNRGSLTDAEARKLLKNIEKVEKIEKPSSPIKNLNFSSSLLKKSFEFEENPITETRVIPGKASNNLEIELGRFIKNTKKGMNIQNRKRSINSSIPKAFPITITRSSNSLSSKHTSQKSKSPKFFIP